MNRRKAAQVLAMSAPFMVGCSTSKSLMTKESPILSIIKPQRLKKGNTIGLIAPASSVSAEKLEKSINNLESYGFKVKMGKYVAGQYGYLAATDEERIEDLHAMYSDPEVSGIWCARGGYGCTRLLPMIDYGIIKANPKVLIGYSDVTALLNTIYQLTGIIGFHGPVGASDFNDYTIQGFEQCLLVPNSTVELISHESTEVTVMVNGTTTGTLVGGNLSLLAAMCGTPYEVNFQDKIVFIEDVGEKPYRIDRMLTQLLQAGLNKASGIVLGVFAGCERKEGDISLTLAECLEDRLGSLEMPIMSGLSFGHIDYQFSLPIGVQASINTIQKKLTLKEAGVI